MPVTRFVLLLATSLSAVFTVTALMITLTAPGIDDGLRVIIQDGDGAAALYQLDDGEMTQVTPLDIGDDGYIEYNSTLAWSPNGETLLFQAVRAFDLGEIWVVDPATGEQHPLIRSRTVNMHVSWSADSQRIVVDNDRSSYIQPVDGGQSLLLDSRVLGADVVAVRHAMWSPVEPDLMAAVLLRGDGQARLALLEIGETVTVQRVLMSGYAVIDQLQWTPDGRSLMYRLTAAPYDSYVTSRYHMMDLLTETSRKLTEQPIEPARMTWSPDGRRLAVIEAGRQGAGLYILDMATDTIDAVYEPGDAGMFQHLAWSADGEVLIMGRDENATCGVSLLDVRRSIQVQPFPPDLGPCQVFATWW